MKTSVCCPSSVTENNVVLLNPTIADGKTHGGGTIAISANAMKNKMSVINYFKLKCEVWERRNSPSLVLARREKLNSEDLGIVLTQLS